MLFLCKEINIIINFIQIYFDIIKPYIIFASTEKRQNEYTETTTADLSEL